MWPEQRNHIASPPVENTLVRILRLSLVMRLHWVGWHLQLWYVFDFVWYRGHTKVISFQFFAENLKWLFPYLSSWWQGYGMTCTSTSNNLGDPYPMNAPGLCFCAHRMLSWGYCLPECVLLFWMERSIALNLIQISVIEKQLFFWGSGSTHTWYCQ